MNRGYAIEEILPKLKKIHQINPLALLATDIIVGFPGETEEDFQKTYDFVKNSPICKVHIFPFSPRPKTKAFELSQKSPPIISKTLKSRLSALKNLSDQKFTVFQKSLLGLTLEALFLAKRVGDYQEALLPNQIPVFVKTKKDLKGEIKKIHLKNFQEEKLLGEIL